MDKISGQIFWNTKLAGDFTPKSYSIDHYSVILKAKKATNVLLIRGLGGLECYGFSINNVKLVRKGSKDNIIVNGNFD